MLSADQFISSKNAPSSASSTCTSPAGGLLHDEDVVSTGVRGQEAHGLGVPVVRLGDGQESRRFATRARHDLQHGVPETGPKHGGKGKAWKRNDMKK